MFYPIYLDHISPAPPSSSAPPYQPTLYPLSQNTKKENNNKMKVQTNKFKRKYDKKYQSTTKQIYKTAMESFRADQLLSVQPALERGWYRYSS